MKTKKTFKPDELRYLRLLARQYPKPKFTESFFSFFGWHDILIITAFLTLSCVL